ncbi:SDR family oxidoreductase [Pontibacter anaerobius]|uniref:SDR family oxidoreductase n=1 Tax=Pontibacter anaerobius TaxID=2993940 RepID=A0ABT3RFM8_9BACT|nr:SDR family oxidoreductase [Pontibacter anaerobius]MCX2740203.1 SDR family oxidoreductase [Pontibacter anaerobius]
MNENIKGKVVVITGASSGLGEATAQLLAEQGASLVLAARRAERIEKIAEGITAIGGKALAVPTDVSAKEQVENLVKAAVDKFGKIDVLLNNAGLMPLSPIESLKTDEWDQMIDVNIKGVLYGMAAVLPHMKQQKSGQIINVSSVAGHKVFPRSTVYSATKSAVRVISEGFRQEVTPYNIRTTIISPGAVKTELLEHISDQDIQKNNQEYVGKIGLSPDAFARLISFSISQPEEMDINEILFRPTAQEL